MVQAFAKDCSPSLLTLLSLEVREQILIIQWQATTDRSCCQPACLQGSLHQSVREIARRTSYSTMMGYSVSAFLSSLLGSGTCTRQAA